MFLFVVKTNSDGQLSCHLLTGNWTGKSG